MMMLILIAAFIVITMVVITTVTMTMVMISTVAVAMVMITLIFGRSSIYRRCFRGLVIGDRIIIMLDVLSIRIVR